MAGDDVLIRIGADVGDIKQAIAGIQSSLGSLSSSVKSSFSEASSSIKGSMADASTSVSGLSGSVSTLKTTVGALGAAFGLRAVAGFARDLIDTASQVEQLKIRMQALTGSIEAGNKVWDLTTKLAEQLPFTLEQSQKAMTQLTIAFGGNTKELEKWGNFTAGLAARFGLSFEEAAEQITRSLAAGAASADLFQKRGVSAFLGFQQGAAYSTEQTRKQLESEMQRLEPSTKDALAKLTASFEGSMGLIQDKWFKVQNTFMDEGPFNILKSLFLTIDSQASTSFGSITNAAKAMGEEFAASVLSSAKSMASLIDVIYAGVKAVEDFGINARKWIGNFSVANVVKKIAGTIDPELKDKQSAIEQFFGSIKESVNNAFKGGAGPIAGPATKFVDEVIKKQGELNQSSETASKSLAGIGKAAMISADKLGGAGKSAKAHADALKNLSDSSNEAIKSLKGEAEALGLSERDAFIFQKTHERIANLEKSSLPDKQALIDSLRTSAGALFDEKTAVDANKQSKEDLKNISDNLKKSLEESLVHVKAENEAYQLGIKDVKAYADEKLRAQKAAVSGDPQLIALEKEEAAAKQVNATFEEGRKLSDAAAKKAEEDWKQTSEIIEQSLTDALLRGFESGKSIAENFKDTLINLFKTLILKPAIQFLVQPLAQALAGGIPGGGTAGGAGAVDFSPAGVSQLGNSFKGAMGFLKSPLTALGNGFDSLSNSLMSLLPRALPANIGKLIGGAGAGAGFGMAGGMLGNLLGFKGTGADVGGLLGGAGGGALASLIPASAAIPGIGPIVAAVGGLLGTILGGSLFKKPVPRAAMFGHFQGDQFQIQDWAKGGGATSTIKPIFDQTIGLLRTLSKEIGFSVDQLRASVQFEGKTGKFAGEVLGKGPRFETGKFSLEDEESIKRGLSEMITKVLSQVELPKRFKSVVKETTVEGVATRVQAIKDFEKALVDLKGAAAPLIKDWNDMLQQLGDMHAKAVDFGFGLGAVTKATDKAITQFKENFMRQFTGADEMPKTWKQTKDDFKDFIKSMREVGKEADFSERHLDILTKEAWENFNKKMEESRKSIMAAIEDMSGTPQNPMREFKDKMKELRNSGLAAGISVSTLDAAIKKSTQSFRGQIQAEKMRDEAAKAKRIPETKAQLIELTGREAPVGLQFRLFKSQLKEIQASFIELGMNMDNFRELKMEAIGNFFRDLKRKVKEQLYELAGKQLPVAFQFAGLKQQLRDLKETWLELGLDMGKFRELKTDSIKHFFRQLRTQAIQGMYELAGKPLPVAVQFGILKRQIKDLRDLWKELGMSMDLFRSLRADAVKSFFRNLRTQAVQGIYELVGKPIPVAAQLGILRRQIKDLKELWQQLGMSMGLFNTLKAEAISNFFFNLKKQVMEGMHELAGRPLPVAFQFKILKRQIKDLQEIWQQLGLSMALFKDLKAEAISNFFFNLKKSTMEGMAELAGRPLPVGIQLQFLNKQIKNLYRQWRELGLSISLFNELRADAITNFFFNLQKQAVEGMAEISDTPIPVSFQLKGLNKQIKELQRQWQELGLNMRQFGELKTEAVRNFFLNLRKQAIGGMHELAGRPLPVGFQFEVLNKQINNLQRIWQGLGLSMGQFKELKAESVKNFFFNLRKQVVDGLYELAGRPVYVPLAFEALKQQLRVFQKSWLELGGNLQHFRALKADAIRNFYDNLRKQTLEGIYQLAGRPLPVAYITEGLNKQFRDLQKVWEDIGLSLAQFKSLKAEAITNFFDNLRDQTLEGLYSLAGRPMPVAIQFEGLKKQIRNIQHTWLELGMSLQQFKELKAEAIAKFYDDLREKTIQGLYELTGKPLPVAMQRLSLKKQLTALQRTWLELGMSLDEFKKLKADAIKNFFDNLKKQAMEGIYELAGKPLPIAFQFDALSKQIENLRDMWSQLGLSMNQFNTLKTTAITRFFDNLKKTVMEGMYGLAGRPLPVAFQLSALQKQIDDFRETWNELGLSLDLFKELSTQAVTNFFDKLKKDVLDELYSLAGEPIPLNMQIAALKKRLQELKVQFTELNLPLSLFEKLSKKAMDKLVEDYNKAKTELERAKGGFIGFLSKTGEILSEAPAVERTVTKQPEKGFATGALNQIFNRPSVIQVGERGPEEVDVRPVGSNQGVGGVTIQFQGPNIMDAISAGIFARTVERQMSKRRARFA